MDQNNAAETGVSNLDELREAIALVQVLELNDHSGAYEQIHTQLEEALRSIDGK
jgi:hypothetical protein